MKSKRLKLLIAGLLAGASVLAIPGSAAAGLISDKFDGEYVGRTKISNALAPQSCGTLPLEKVSIENGNLWGMTADGQRVARGWVTDDGFFTGEYTLPDGSKTEFEGLVDEAGVFTGGVVDRDCAWIADLSRVSNDGAI